MLTVMLEFKPLMYPIAKESSIDLFWYFKVYEEGYDSNPATKVVVKTHLERWSPKKSLHNDFDASKVIIIAYLTQYKSLKLYPLIRFKAYRIDSMHQLSSQTE